MLRQVIWLVYNITGSNDKKVEGDSVVDMSQLT
jgi:hypothetical protein